MTLRDSPPLSPREVRTLLQFASHRFSTLEIVVGGIADGRTLLEALSPDFLSFLDGPDSKLMYICIPNEQPLQENLFQFVISSIHTSLRNVTNISLRGVHVASSPEIGAMNRNIELLEKVVNVNMTTDGVSLGLYVQQCEQFIGHLLSSKNSISTTAAAVQEQSSSKMGYLVCSVSGAHTVDHFENAEAGWYMARALKRAAPNLTLITKPSPENLLMSKIRDAETYVKLVDYSVRHGTLHKLNTFIVLLASHSSRAAGLGWWNITDYSNLADTKVYTELESGVLGTQTWVPPTAFQDDEQPPTTVNNNNTIEQSSSSVPSQNWFVWVGVGTISAVLFITVTSVAVWICVLRGRVRFLSKQEIHEFRNGGVQVEVGLDSNLYSTLKYNTSYEISKEGLNLGSASLLGMGNFGRVVKAWVKGNLAAIKMPNDNCSRESFRSMLIEVKVMCHLGTHPNLVELVGCHTSEIRWGMIYIVTVLCENGSLQSCLRNKEVPPVQFQEMVKFAHEIACGMDFIAGKNVVHGDLSARNVLLDSHNICKIADFGLSRKLYEYNMYVKQSQEPLPWRWMSYEALFKMEFTSSSDVWSYGVTLWEIFSLGAVPYPGVNWTHHAFVEELKTGLRMNSPEFATPEIYEMMLKCWNLEPKARPNFEQLVQFFIPFRDAEYENLGD